jgi:hypothetical protein
MRVKIVAGSTSSPPMPTSGRELVCQSGRWSAGVFSMIRTPAESHAVEMGAWGVYALQEATARRRTKIQWIRRLIVHTPVGSRTDRLVRFPDLLLLKTVQAKTWAAYCEITVGAFLYRSNQAFCSL